MFNRTVVLSIAGLALLVSIVAPWVTAFGAFGFGPLDSAELGIVLGSCVVLITFTALTGKYMRPISIVTGLAVLGEAIHTFVKIQQGKDGEFGDVISPGWGLYLAILVGLFLIVSTWLVHDKPVQKSQVVGV